MARGDRPDGYLLRDVDPMHIIMPLVWPNRCENEAFIFERLDCSAVDAYLEAKNAAAREAEGDTPDFFKYTMFHFVVAAMMKIMTLRPHLNRFIANKRLYQHKELSGAFVVKKQFVDDAEEGLAVFKAQPADNIDSVREFVRAQVCNIRGSEGGESGSKGDTTSDAMDALVKIPFFLVRFVAFVVRKLEKHGRAPQALVGSDLFQNSVVFSNLGSIQMKAGYHHLENWGTTSLFVTIGEKKLRPFFNEDGTSQMLDSLDLGISIDERIADGYYYSKTLRLLRALFTNPELLDAPFSQEVEY